MTNKSTKQESKVHGSECGIKSVQVSCSPVINYAGEKSYRTVYGLQEVVELFVDTELINKRYEEEAWEAEVTTRLFWFDGQKAVAIAGKTDKMTVEKEEGILRYEELFTKEDLSQFTLREGIYRVLVEINGVGAQSDDLYLMEGQEQVEGYFHTVHAGIDKCCEESEEAGNARSHSFRVLNREGLQDVRFYMLAQNRLKREWVYEFVIYLLNRNGGMKAVRVVKSGQYVKDPEGNSLLCFAIDLGAGEADFWTEGEYNVKVSCFDQLVFELNFMIGDREEPYAFDREISGMPAENVAQTMRGGGETVATGSKEEILDRLYHLVGLRKVKEEITQMCEHAEFIRLRRENGFNDRFPQLHMIFTGHPGTGKNTVAEIIGALFYKLGMLTTPKVTHCQRKDLVQEGGANEEQLVRQALASGAGGVLFVDCAGDLFDPGNPNDRGVVALSVLLHILTQERPGVLVILSDDEEEMKEMLHAIPDWKKIFTHQLCFEDYTPEELMEITRNKLDVRQLRLNPVAEDKLFKLLKKSCTAKEFDFTNGRFIDEKIEEMALRMSKRVMSNRSGEYKREELMEITAEDIVVEPEVRPEQLMEKLNALVGLGPLKQSVAQHLNYIYFVRERQQHGFTDVLPPQNMVFIGNPGTGKRTVAGVLGEIFHSIGILSRPEVVVHNGHNLAAAGAGGMTPEQGANILLESAEEAILYIDQADALMDSPFGVGLLEILLSSLSTEECGDRMIILSGYPEQMEKMLGNTPTLKTYFPHQFHFSDYTPEELLGIAEFKLKEKDYAFHPKAKEAFEELIRKMYEVRNKRFGNARLVEKMVEKAIRNMSARTMQVRENRELTRKEVITIMAVDVPVDEFKMPELDKDTFDENEIALALKDLDHLVGQDKIKKQIRDFVELARHYTQQGIKLSSQVSLQWCFTGNSGMGKGTVARIIGRLYKAMGIVESGHVFDFKVEKLIGQTEEEAMRGIGEGLTKSNGGIFLFDEDSPKLNEAVGFKERVRAILMNQMAERPGAYTVIYAESQSNAPGFNGNAEHVSEIINMLVFEDYDKEELMLVLKRRLAKEKMQLTQTARQHMVQFIEQLLTSEERSHASARLMRIVADLIVRNSLQRTARNGVKIDPAEMISVQKQDVEMFTNQFIMDVLNERKKIGYKI